MGSTSDEHEHEHEHEHERRALISIPLGNIAAVQAERLKIDQGLVASHMLVHQNRGGTRPVKSMPKMPSSDIAIGVRVQGS